MTLSEFKAWFEGFTESIEGAPTEAQFAKIKAKVADIDGAPVTERIYVDRWWPTVRPYWDRLWWGTTGDATTASYATSNHYAANAAYGNKGAAVTEPFDSHAAMRDLGRMEAVN